jgi:hypothetical protein
MSHSSIGWRVAAVAAVLSLAACQDAPAPLGPQAEPRMSQAAGQELSAWFASASPEVMALPQTVFASVDERAGVLVFGVEHAGVARGIEQVMARRGVPRSAYQVRVTEPIHFMSATLTSEHRPVVGGVQIHWGQYVCTLGFSVDHAGGRSFITNSHCTDRQGTTGNTQYNQPSRTASPDPIGFEADDPAYTRGGGCSPGKLCRYSDAARALYVADIASLARIAKTTGVNSGSLTVSGHFGITSQDHTTTRFSGEFHKVGRTTGWTSGSVTNTCATVNVSGSNIQLRCQTLVQRAGTRIVGAGDSGSPVFTHSGGNATLVGILWGGSSSGDLFVFSPLKNIRDELGAMTATTDGTGGGGSTPPDDPPDDGDNGGGNCPPGNPSHRNCQT